ncbi:hypothetical protein KIPB_016336, partial [Kipferlia bialata]
IVDRVRREQEQELADAAGEGLAHEAKGVRTGDERLDRWWEDSEDDAEEQILQAYIVRKGGRAGIKRRSNEALPKGSKDVDRWLGAGA